MALKALLFLCLGFLAIQAYRTDIEPLDEVEVQDFIDTAKKLWEKLKGLVQSAIDKAKEECNKIINKIKAKANEIKEWAKGKIQDAMNVLLGDLEKLKDKAKEAGVDISDCTKDNEDNLKNVGISLVTKLISCITDIITQAVNIVTDVIDKAKGTYNDVVDLGRQIDDCGTGWHAVTCVTKIVGKMTLDVTELPFKIASDVLKATEMVLGLEDDLETCAAFNIAQVAIDGGKILAIITECVNDKLNQ